MMEYKVVVNEDVILWYKPGTDERHREDGPAIEWNDGDKSWYLNGKYHREDGPAIENANGYKAWWLNGKRHREDGPAVEYASGSKHWYLDGKRHREDGPAFEYADGSKFWYLDGEKLSEAEFNQKMNSCQGKIVEIDGRTYTLTLVK